MMHESLTCHKQTMLYVVELMVICMGTSSVDSRENKKTAIGESKYQTNYIDLPH